jgi:hypothetical protein
MCGFFEEANRTSIGVARWRRRKAADILYTVLQTLPFSPEGERVSGSCFIDGGFTTASRSSPAPPSPQAFSLSGELPASWSTLARLVETVGLRRAWFSLVSWPASSPCIQAVYPKSTANVIMMTSGYYLTILCASCPKARTPGRTPPNGHGPLVRGRRDAAQ